MISKLVVVEFANYVIIWWDQLVTSKRHNGERIVDIWEEMKVNMRTRFIPYHYYKNYITNCNFYLGALKASVNILRRSKIIIIRANIYEDREAIMTKFKWKYYFCG